jgi:F-type H+-transporting ATPase subunit b
MFGDFATEPEFWVAIAFLIVIVGLVWKGSPMIIGALDDRAGKIKAEIDEADRLRRDAQRMLGEYQRKQRDSLKDAEQIVALAKGEAERAAVAAARELEAALQRRRALALEKIALEEAKAAAEVRNTAVDVAIAAARQMLAQDLDAPRKSQLIDAAIVELPQLLH